MSELAMPSGGSSKSSLSEVLRTWTNCISEGPATTVEAVRSRFVRRGRSSRARHAFRTSLEREPRTDLLDFEDPELLRATRLLTVLHSAGRMLASSVGSAETYKLSQCQPAIGAFISHNWSMSRMLKFVLLVMHFNLVPALVAALAVMLLIVVGSCTGWVPAVATPIGETGFVGTCCVTPTFFVVLLFGHELAGMLGQPGRWVFLDKVCIHQEDKTRQRQGILKLGGFLKHSSSVVVLFSDMYLKKLWTVYEVATYLVTHKGSTRTLHILPSGVVVMALASIVVPVAGVALLNVIRSLGLQVSWQSVQIGAIFAATCVLTPLARLWGYEQRKAMEAVRKFSILDAQCAVATDRDLVCANAITLMREYRYVGEEVEDGEALKVFDSFVRKAVPTAFYASLGPTTLPYRLLLPMGVCLFSELMDVWAGMYRSGRFESREEAAYHLIANATTAFVTIPLITGLAMIWGRSLAHLSWPQEIAFTCSGIPLISALFLFGDPSHVAGLLSGLLLDRAARSPACRAAFLTSCALQGLLAVLVYNVPARFLPHFVTEPRSPPSSERDAQPRKEASDQASEVVAAGGGAAAAGGDAAEEEEEELERGMRGDNEEDSTESPYALAERPVVELN